MLTSATSYGAFAQLLHAAIDVGIARGALDDGVEFVRTLDVSSALFEVSGTRSAAAEYGLDRHWRNARTHTLHDPVRWKYQHIGRAVLRGEVPPRHGSI